MTRAATADIGGLAYWQIYEICRWATYTTDENCVWAKCTACDREAVGEILPGEWVSERSALRILHCAGPCPSRRASRATEVLQRILFDVSILGRVELATVVRLGLTEALADSVQGAWRACNDPSVMSDWIAASMDSPTSLYVSQTGQDRVIVACDTHASRPNRLHRFEGSMPRAADWIRRFVPDPPLGMLEVTPCTP